MVGVALSWIGVARAIVMAIDDTIFIAVQLRLSTLARAGVARVTEPIAVKVVLAFIWQVSAIVAAIRCSVPVGVIFPGVDALAGSGNGAPEPQLADRARASTIGTIEVRDEAPLPPGPRDLDISSVMHGNRERLTIAPRCIIADGPREKLARYDGRRRIGIEAKFKQSRCGHPGPGYRANGASALMRRSATIMPANMRGQRQCGGQLIWLWRDAGSTTECHKFARLREMRREKVEVVEWAWGVWVLGPGIDLGG